MAMTDCGRVAQRAGVAVGHRVGARMDQSDHYGGMTKLNTTDVRHKLSGLLIAVGWWVCLGIGVVGLLLMVAGGVLALFNRPKLGPTPLVFAALCLVYFCYWSLGGFLHPPMDGYSNSMWRIAPVLVVGWLALVLPIDSKILGWPYLRMLWVGGSLSLYVLTSIALFEVWQYEMTRPKTLHGNPLLASYAGVASVMLPLCLWHCSGLYFRALLLLNVAVGLVVLLIWLQARSHFLLLAVSVTPLLTYFLLQSVTGPRRWWWRLAIILAVAVVGALAVYWLWEIWDSPTADRLRSGIGQVIAAVRGETGVKELDFSFAQRQEMWSEGLRVFSQSPLFGYGIQHRFDAIDISVVGLGYSHLHNSVITHAVAGGVIGILLYLAILFFPFWHWIWCKINSPYNHENRTLTDGVSMFWLGLLAVLCPLISGLTNVVMFESTLSTLALFPLAVWAAAWNHQGHRKQSVKLR